MKILLYILAVLQLVSTAISFFQLLPASLWLALLILFIGILQLVLTIAVIMNMTNIEELTANLSYLYTKVHKLEEDSKEIEVAYSAPIKTEGEIACKAWKCIKCDTVNKAGTTHCENCNCEFSGSLNPTFDPNPDKMSRFLKEKKKLFKK